MSVLHPTVRWPLAYRPSMRIHLSREVVVESLDRALQSVEEHCASASHHGSGPHYPLAMLKQDTTRLDLAFTSTVCTQSARRLVAPMFTIAGAEVRRHSWSPERSVQEDVDSALWGPRRPLLNWIHQSLLSWQRQSQEWDWTTRLLR